MSRIDLTLSASVQRSLRVEQVEGMFDVSPSERADFQISIDIPIEERPWQIGLITGPSGSGKSSLARHLWPERVNRKPSWSAHDAVLDGFAESLSTKEIVRALSSVGFSSPPDWLKPYHVLSTGQQFRCDLARTLLDHDDLAIVDEYTSLVDRVVAKIGSAAVAKAVRRTPERRLVAITCHDDVEAWLQPDWVCEPGAGVFRWRSLQRRPAIALRLMRCDRAAWSWFHRHHYLNANCIVAQDAF